MTWTHLGAAGLTAFLLAVVLTPPVIRVATRVGMVAHPQADRWHRRPTALMGGLAIFGGFVVSAIIFIPLDPRVLSLLAGTVFMFVLGVVDDVRPLSPQTKFIGQIVAACIPVFSGVVFSLPWYAPFNVLVTVLWIVGISNAINLLDNMDGLAAGTTLISSGFLLGFAIQQQFLTVALVVVCLGAAAAGFLLYNFYPAKIFMGDSGSLVLGYVLATATALGQLQPKIGLIWTLLAPVSILGLPIFDTCFVVFMRLLHGRKISQGGRDHTSHRLVALGLTERTAVLILYAVSAALGSLALLHDNLMGVPGLVLAAIALGTLLTFGRLLAQVEVYPPGKQNAVMMKWLSRGGVILPRTYFNKKRVMEVLQDVLLIAASIGGTLVLQDETIIFHPGVLAQTAKALPVILGVKIVALLAFGVYRGVWRFASSHDVWRILGALVTAQIALAFVLPPYLPVRNVVTWLVVDWLLTFNLLGGVRFLLKVLMDLFTAIPRSGNRVLIYGAERSGTAVLREIRGNPKLGLQPVGFIDDDPDKYGSIIAGTPVMGSVNNLPELAQKYAITELIVARPSISRDELLALQDTLSAQGVHVRCFQALTLTRVGRTVYKPRRNLV